MRILSFLTIILLTSRLCASEPPKVIRQLNYKLVCVQIDGGTEQEVFIVRPREKLVRQLMNRYFKRLDFDSMWFEEGILYIARTSDDQIVVKALAPKFICFSFLEI